MFDTLAVARRLTEAGIDPAHADALASAIREAAEHHRAADFASRADLAALEARIYRAMLIQTGALLAGVAALMRVFG